MQKVEAIYPLFFYRVFLPHHQGDEMSKCSANSTPQRTCGEKGLDNVPVNLSKAAALSESPFLWMLQPDAPDFFRMEIQVSKTHITHTTGIFAVLGDNQTAKL